MAELVDTLVFDGECGFCRSCVVWLERRLASPVAIVAWQEADLVALGVSAEDCRSAVQWVGATGRRSAGAAAVAEVLRAARWPWPAVGRLLGLPLVRIAAAAVYRVTARNRSCLVQPGDEPVDRGGLAPK